MPESDKDDERKTPGFEAGGVVQARAGQSR